MPDSLQRTLYPPQVHNIGETQVSELFFDSDECRCPYAVQPMSARKSDQANRNVYWTNRKVEPSAWKFRRTLLPALRAAALRTASPQSSLSSW